MSKLSHEEIEVQYNKNWFKNRVLDELINKLNPTPKPISYYKKNKERIKEQQRLNKLYKPSKK